MGRNQLVQIAVNKNEDAVLPEVLDVLIVLNGAASGRDNQAMTSCSS